MASAQRHEAGGDEVVKLGASTAPDTLLSIMETCSHAHVPPHGTIHIHRETRQRTHIHRLR